MVANFKFGRKPAICNFENVSGLASTNTLVKKIFFGHFHIIKSDKSKNVSGYGLYEYIDEGKKVKKKLQKKLCRDIRRNSPFLVEFQHCGHFLDPSP